MSTFRTYILKEKKYSIFNLLFGLDMPEQAVYTQIKLNRLQIE